MAKNSLGEVFYHVFCLSLSFSVIGFLFSYGAVVSVELKLGIIDIIYIFDLIQVLLEQNLIV
jgi:hypothetical protein